MAGQFEKDLESLLKGAKKTVVMAVGDELDPRDCVGNLAGKKISSLRLEGVEVLLTSQMPENFTSVVRRMKPSHVVLIDAAEMGKSPGDVAVIEPGRVLATRVSTHAMPLSVLMKYIEKELGASVTLVGIQPASPDQVGFGKQPAAVQKGIDRIAQGLKAAMGRR